MGKKHVPAVLLLYHRPPWSRDAGTVWEHIRAFGKHSRFRFCAVNTGLGFPGTLASLEFSAVVFHYSLFGGEEYPIENRFLDYVDGWRSSYRVAFFQDEYQFCPQRARFIDDHRIDCIYTLLEDAWIPRVYGDRRGVGRIIPTLTGYVDERLVSAGLRYGLPDDLRSIDIGYRGRELLPYMGRAAREKTAIAEEFKRATAAEGLKLDIETRENQRLYGKSWHEFLGKCRGCLGVEAGVSVFDLEGVVYERYDELRREDPAASFDEMVDMLAPVMDPWEGQVYYRTISPRHFEAAAFRACQILFPGRYSGIMEPMRHYIPLEKDFSNIEEVVRLFRTTAVREELVENANRDLIQSGSYSYEHFVQEFDRVLTCEGVSADSSVSLGTASRLSHARTRPESVLKWLKRGARMFVYRRVLPWLVGSRFGDWITLPVLRRMHPRLANRCERWKEHRR